MKKIYQAFLLLFFFATVASSVLAQNSFFMPMSEAAVSVTNANRVIIPEKYNTLKADMNQLKTFLWSLPSKQNVTPAFAPIMEIPMPDGKAAKFRVWESSIQEPGLEAQFPDIKTFAGQGIDDPYASIRFDMGPRGFHAQVLTINGSYYIDPYSVGSNISDYISYFRKDLLNRNGSWTCDVPDYVPSPNSNIITAACRGTELRTYRLAVACTGEYAQAPGINAGTNPVILHNAIVTSVNRVVGVYETELSISMVLVLNNGNVEFLNAATDPFNGNNNAGTLINESQVVCDNFIGSSNYDIGHTFSTGGGGLAQLQSPCGSSKARGITGSSNPTGDAYNIDYVAHEMGHQFGGNHSMAGCGSSPNSTKYEVGSGTTIQAYAGICGGENIQPNSDPFFHGISFDEISNFVGSGGGTTCGVITATTNQIPVINALGNNGVSIPISTPFTLTGSATDPDGDPLTYCWEQWDFSGSGNTTWNAGTTAGAGNSVPLFKSRIPKATGSRTFPDLAVILAGYPANPASAMGGLKGETLSPVARAMKFKLSVRDNKANGGGLASSGAGGCQSAATFQINVVATPGPFAVTAPNGGEVWNGGSTQNISWNVVNTNLAPISCANVRITMSTDAGLTYPTVISASTPNDGTEAVTIPNINSTTTRIRIEAEGNIFFDISNANFTINFVNNPTFEFVPSATSTVACASASATTTLATTSILGFVTPINLVAAGNPGGTSVNISVNPLIPGNSTDVTLNGINTLAPGTYNVTITGTAGTEVKSTILSYVISPGAGPAVTAQPAAQIICVNTNTSFSITSASATAFQWQVSTNGGGSWTNLTNGAVYAGATTAALSLTAVTAVMNNYQYRCIASVLCGSTNSNAALLTVQTAPAITNQPGSNTVCGGANVSSFSVTATGASLTYQWQESVTGCGGPWNNIANGGIYSGATTATLTLTAATTAMNGYGYRCVINGTCTPAATSNCGALTVNTPVSISAQPASSTICAGTNTSFVIAASGTAPTYQWQESTNGGTAWTNVSNGAVYAGVTTNTLTLTGVTAGMTGYQYRCVVNGTAPCGSVNSTAVTLTVDTAPAITTQPVATTTLCVGGNTTYTVAANGTALTYQWQESTNGGTSWSNLVNAGVYSGVTTATLTVTGVTAAMNSTQYRCVISGTCTPAATSSSTALTVNTPISFSAQPAAKSICATGNTSFSVAASGTAPTYQWQVSTNGTTWTNVANGGVYSGSTTNTLNLTAVTATMDTYQYRCVVTGAAPCVAANSNSALLNVTPQPVITASPYTSLLAGWSTTLTVNVTPSPGLSFAWYLNGALQSATGNSVVATVNTLGNYRVIVTSATNSCQSELINIKDSASSKLFVFPSPNNGLFKVSYYTPGASSTNSTTQNITIYDSYGRRVLNKVYPVSQAYQLHDIDLRRNGAGIYYIVLREANGNKIKTGEVVVR